MITKLVGVAPWVEVGPLGLGFPTSSEDGYAARKMVSFLGCDYDDSEDGSGVVASDDGDAFVLE